MATFRQLFSNVHKKVFIPVTVYKSFLHLCFSPDGDEMQGLSTAPKGCSRHVAEFLEQSQQLGDSGMGEGEKEWSGKRGHTEPLACGGGEYGGCREFLRERE